MSEFTAIGSETTRQGSQGGEWSASTAVSSFREANWWTEEEARLYKAWAGASDQYQKNIVNPYFDYFFSGQDVKIKVDGLEDNKFLPIYAFGYAIQQEKTPLYGYASYTYDAMLRGTRIISGMFSLVVTEPFLLTTHIADSAALRAKTSQSGSSSGEALRHLDGDMANIEYYWKKTHDSSRDIGQKHLFSIHPPFNFLIKYGIQDIGLYSKSPDSDKSRVNEVRKDFQSNGPMWADTNERLYDTSTGSGIPNGGQILLENIELTSKSVEYDSSGDPILETYGFIARDERIISDPGILNQLEINSQNTGYNPVGTGNVPR